LVSDKPQQWHELLSSCVFAYNTSVSSTTDVSPFQLMFGRLPHGPVQVLKENWFGDIDDWPTLFKSSQVLLSEVHDRFKVGFEYARQYNKRAKHK